MVRSRIRKSRRVDHIVFAWENLGPMHADRLDALSSRFPKGPMIVALEFYEQSEAYPWRSVRNGDWSVRTLCKQRKSNSEWQLAIKLIKASFQFTNADYYLCNYQRWPVFITAIVLRMFGRKVFALFNSKFDDRPRRISLEMFKYLLFLPYSGALCGSIRARDYLVFLGVPKKCIQTGYNTVSVDRIARLSNAPPAPDGLAFFEREFVVIARLIPKKNIAMVIDAYTIWLSTTRRARTLRICGSGPLEAELKEKVRLLNLEDHILFEGFIQTEEVSRRLAQALCLILPSIEEQFGNVVIEAQAVGVPVLVSSAAGAADMLLESGVNGFIMNPDSARGCAALMMILSEDRIRWASFATASYSTRHRGDVSRFVSGVEELSGLNGHSPRSIPSVPSQTT